MMYWMAEFVKLIVYTGICKSRFIHWKSVIKIFGNLSYLRFTDYGYFHKNGG